MDAGFPYGDIIVIGAIAAFIILRYRAMLGEKTGRDITERPAAQPLDDYERVIQLPERAQVAAVKNLIIPPLKDYGALSEAFAAMRKIDAQFSPDEFIEGARGAYEMVIDAYNTADHDTLKMLLSPVIYKNFKDSLEKNKAEDRKAHTTLLAITKAEMDDAKLKGNVATVTVHFLSEQVHLVRDTQDKIIEGNPSQQDAVEDHWVFERNLTSTDPNWKVIET